MLPAALSTIYQVKQKSYKMVLILSLIEYYEETNLLICPLNTVAKRFLTYYRDNSKQNKQVDTPPIGIASNWDDFTLTQIITLLKTPLEALSHILSIDEHQKVTFSSHIISELNTKTIQDLKEYTLRELKEYNDKLVQKKEFSLQKVITYIMEQYKAARTEQLAGHKMGTLLRREIPERLELLPFVNSNYKIQGSVGQGKWAEVPWIAFMDKRITESTQKGVYIVYLFSEDMESVYLTLAQGITVPIDAYGKKKGYEHLDIIRKKIRKMIPLKGMQTNDEINLSAKSERGQAYQYSTIAYIRYDKSNIPDDDQLLSDLENVVMNYDLYVYNVLNNNFEAEETSEVNKKESSYLIPENISEKIKQIKLFISENGFQYPKGLIENFYLSLKSKPFVILAGVSGTGKTKLVKLFAESIGATADNRQFTLVPVRPDWNDPSDLVGYNDLSGTFRPGILTEILVEASQPENQEKPYFICLDEMNLARVEHYFSDVLSVMETQEWKGERIVTNKLFSKQFLNREDHLLYEGIYIPDNVYLIGTVNMDETTYPFSKKVLDRANTIEFNYIDLQQYPSFTTQEDIIVNPTVHNSFLRSDYIQLKEVYTDFTNLVTISTEKLVKINAILEEIHSQVGFRIRDSICLYMVYNQRFELLSDDEAFDLQLLQKILPRIQGSSLSVKRVLLNLLELTIGRTLPVQDLMHDASDIYTKKQEEKSAKYPLSTRKITFMLRRLEEDGFTSYWIS